MYFLFDKHKQLSKKPKLSSTFTLCLSLKNRTWTKIEKKMKWFGMCMIGFKILHYNQKFGMETVCGQ